MVLEALDRPLWKSWDAIKLFMQPNGIETVVGDVFTRRIACYAEISRKKRQLSANHQLAGTDLMTKQQYQFPCRSGGKFALMIDD